MKALIIIDAQEDFTRGALRNEEAIAALPKIAELIKFARENNMIIFYTQDTHDRDTYLFRQEGKNLPIPHCIYKTKGWEVCPEVDDENFRHINKWGFGYIPWSDEFYNFYPDEIIMCGFCTDICVSANFQILKATFREVPITIVEDCCAGVTPELHDAALKVMKSCQANITTLDKLKEKVNET